MIASVKLESASVLYRRTEPHMVTIYICNLQQQSPTVLVAAHFTNLKRMVACANFWFISTDTTTAPDVQSHPGKDTLDELADKDRFFRVCAISLYNTQF